MLIAGYLLPTVIISNILVDNKILENQIWDPGVALSYKDTIILTPIVYILISIYYIFLITLCIKSLIGLKEKRNSKLMFYYLILLGFIGFYMLTERQSRYAFVCSWLIILIASGAFYKKAEMI